MDKRSILVIGGGISGLAVAWHAVQAGREPLVLEGGARLGGCLDTRTGPDQFWFELGAHTLYNSYGALLDLALAGPSPAAVVARGDARKRFGLLRDGHLTTMGPLSVFRQFGWWELATSAPRGLFGRKDRRTTREHFSRLVGARNYQRVLAPFLSAVPSQPVDDFPAAGPGSLFKKRPRRKQLVKSFTFEGGVGAVVKAVTAAGVEARVEARVVSLTRGDRGYQVELAGGERLHAPVVALATDAATAAGLIEPAHPELAGALARVATVAIDTVGVVVARDAVDLPELAFVVPADDVFWSVVTRDPVPDPHRRAFTFHFKPGLERGQRLARAARLLGVEPEAFELVAERHTVLPAPGRDHAALVADIDRALTGLPLAVAGNYFAGMAIEDCVARARAEWQRVAEQATPG